MQPTLMTSNRDDWGTPRALFRELDSVFHFQLDAAASEVNALCPLFFTKEQNALRQDWYKTLEKSAKREWPGTGTVFLNPPYGTKILFPFLTKVKQEYDKGLTIVCLVAARTETKWFRIGWDYARYICFFYGRLKFELPTGTFEDPKTVGVATFPSALLIFSQFEWNLHEFSTKAKIIENQITNLKHHSHSKFIGRPSRGVTPNTSSITQF